MTFDASCTSSEIKEKIFDWRFDYFHNGNFNDHVNEDWEVSLNFVYELIAKLDLVL